MLNGYISIWSFCCHKFQLQIYKDLLYECKLSKGHSYWPIRIFLNHILSHLLNEDYWYILKLNNYYFFLIFSFYLSILSLFHKLKYILFTWCNWLHDKNILFFWFCYNLLDFFKVVKHQICIWDKIIIYREFPFCTW